MDEPTGRLDGFLLRESDANWWAAPEIVQYSVDFASCAYRDELFGLLNIDRPMTLDQAVVKRRAEFLAGRYCAAHVLRQLDSLACVGIGSDRSPAWPPSVTGSISHSSNLAVAVATRDRAVLGLGIDIENRIAPDAAREVQSLVLNSAERAWLTHPQLAPEDVLTLIFSVKESFYKALYPSVNAFFGFEAVNVTAIDTQARKVHFILNTPLAGGRWTAGRRFVAEYRQLAPDVLATLVLVRAV